MLQHGDPRTIFTRSLLSSASLGSSGTDHGQTAEPFAMGIEGLASPMRLVWTPSPGKDHPHHDSDSPVATPHETNPIRSLSTIGSPAVGDGGEGLEEEHHSAGMEELINAGGTDPKELDWLHGAENVASRRGSLGVASLAASRSPPMAIMEQMMMDRAVLLEEIEETRKELSQAHEDNRLLVVEFTRLQELAARGSVQLAASVTGLQV